MTPESKQAAYAMGLETDSRGRATKMLTAAEYLQVKAGFTKQQAEQLVDLVSREEIPGLRLS